LQHSPTLQSYPYQLRLSEAERLQAALRPNPEVQLSLDNVAGSGDYQGIDQAELTLSLSQVIELGDKRALRLETVQWQQQLRQQQFEVLRLDSLAATTRSYIQQVELQQLHLHIKRRIEREQQLLALATQRAQASSLGEVDVAKLELRLTRSQLELQALQNAVQLGSAQLAAHWAQTPDFQQVEGSLAALPLLPSLAELQTSLQQTPSMQQFITQARLDDTLLRQAQAAQNADLTLSTGLRYHAQGAQQRGDHAFVLSVSMPWQRDDPSAGTRLAAQTQRELTALTQQQTERTLQLVVTQIYLELEQLRHYSQVLQRHVIPKSQQVLALSEQGYQQGQVDLFGLLSAAQDAHQAEVDLIQAQSRFHLQLLELERLTGHAMTLSGPVRWSTKDTSYE
jgi:cobalt-zinc-cadmium efflux system outer membrane protein